MRQRQHTTGCFAAEKIPPKWMMKTAFKGGEILTNKKIKQSTEDCAIYMMYKNIHVLQEKKRSFQKITSACYCLLQVSLFVLILIIPKDRNSPKKSYLYVPNQDFSVKRKIYLMTLRKQNVSTNSQQSRLLTKEEKKH